MISLLITAILSIGYSEAILVHSFKINESCQADGKEMSGKIKIYNLEQNKESNTIQLKARVCQNKDKMIKFRSMLDMPKELFTVNGVNDLDGKTMKLETSNGLKIITFKVSNLQTIELNGELREVITVDGKWHKSKKMPHFKIFLDPNKENSELPWLAIELRLKVFIAKFKFFGIYSESVMEGE